MSDPRTITPALNAMLRLAFPHDADYREVGDVLARSRLWDTSDLVGVTAADYERLGMAFGHARRLARGPVEVPFSREAVREEGARPDLSNRETVGRLRQVYAERYPEAGDIRRLLKLAGLNPARVTLMGAPYIMWDNAIEEARKGGRMDVLYDVIRKESPQLV